MRRIWIGVALLVIVLVVGTGLTIAFSRLHTPISQTLDDAGRAAMDDDWEKAAALARAARTDWMDIHNFTAAVADHEPLEEMDSLFARLEILGSQHDTTEFAAACAELSCLAIAMAQSQAVTWWALL